MPARPSLRSVLSAGTVIVGVLALTACAGRDAPRPSGSAVPSVNADYRSGQMEIPTTAVPSLDEAINRAPSGTKLAENADKLRGSAMHDAAQSYGARAGLAWESRNINRMLQGKAPELSRVYDFQRLLIKGPDNVMILPPVISEARESYESSDAGKTLRVADTVFEIVDQARFTPVPPIWQTYLVRDYKSPEPPPDVLLPKDGAERDQWKAWVTEGWSMGLKQAQEIFQADLERLERDFQGMLRYKKLLEEGKVSAPVVADAKLGTTGTGQDMRVNDRAVRITRDPSLNVKAPETWSAAPTTRLPDGAPTGPVAPAPAPDARKGAKATPRGTPEEAVSASLKRSSGRRAWDAPETPAQAAPRSF